MLANPLTTTRHDPMIKYLFNPRFHSVCHAVLGPNQSGKTVTALYMMIRCHALGLYDYFGANVPDLKLPFAYDFIEDLETLKDRCVALNANGTHRYLYLGDEMGDWAPQDQPWLNVKFIRELQRIRKYGLSMIGCGISRIDQRILSPSYFHGYMEKLSKKHPDKAIYIDWSNFPVVKKYSVETLPNIHVDGFDTYYKATFFMEKQESQGKDYLLDNRDVKNAIAKARGQTYSVYLEGGGDLSKQGYYNSVDAGILKLYEVARSNSQSTAS